MSKELKDITENVMSQIHQGKIKMKPKIYFIIGSILTFLGAVSAFIVSIFLTSLIRFSLRTHLGQGAQYKLDQMLSNFPWWIVIFTIISLSIGIWLVRKYDFSYKIKPWAMVLSFILIIVVAGFAIDMMGLNDTLRHRGPMKGMMSKYFQNNTPQQDWRR
ncbi:MAG: hypothetical protein KA515_01855 [Candidatus Pacebacteria bacterium]|nr:hypothetical protein [Candidatus Paceibacterota bacterium]